MTNHTMSCLKLMHRIDHGEQPLPGPSRITIFPTNICNLTCEHCWRMWADYDKTYRSEMSNERLLDLVGEARDLGAEEWYFVGGGDPMARGKVVMEMCKKIRDRGMEASIHSNGTLYKPWMMEQIVDTRISSIVTSLDGPTQEINDHIRTGGFVKATQNIKCLSEMKRERGGGRFPQLSIYVTVTNLTYDKLDQFAELAASLGPDVMVEISSLIIEGEGCKQYEMSPEQVAAYPEHIHRGIARAKELGVKNNFAKYLEPKLSCGGFGMNDDFTPTYSGDIAEAMCYEPWGSMAIMPDGKVGPCCAFDCDGAALSVKEMSLADVWRGEYMSRVRAGMLDGNVPGYCDRCPSNLWGWKEETRKVVEHSLKEHRKWEQAGLGTRTGLLVAKGAASLRKHGVLRSVVRSLEWVKMRQVVGPRAASKQP